MEKGNNEKNIKKSIAIEKVLIYTNSCCGMIAVKREVAAEAKAYAGFPWSECQVTKLATSHCTKLIVY